MATYTADYRHDGRYWVAHYREVELSTYSRSLPAAKHAAREALALLLDVDDLDAAAVTVDDHVVIEGVDGADLARLRKDRETMDDLARSVAARTRVYANLLGDRGLSTRDVAEVLGVSAQRVSQYTQHG